VIAPLYIFLFRQRFASADASPRERYSVWSMNFALLGMAILMSWLFGFWTYVLLQLVAWMVAGAGGIWLFYIQHQFEDAYWERDEHWDYTSAALRGSSYYQLPRVLQWLSGNIGFHHIHHLSARIPNYNLQKCHEADPLFQQVKPLTLWQSFKTLRLRLWDEGTRKLVGYRHLRELRKQQKAKR
jgi:acyl-lipid omega-6 desaturase (Delta-12 desaturase)